ncbi:E3 ubiquitin-protein ligase UBR2, partial [Microtus ochrogaster]
WLQATDLTREVYQHLAHCVPKIYCRGPNPYPQKEDTLAQHILLGPMEWYICGEDPALGFPKLEQANKPSHLCGRVFKVGEPTYSCREKSDTYYCMLFNDEVHTYEQVIYTLQKAVNCTQKEAIGFATTVDRDGRRSVRYGDFQYCDQAKSVIVRNTSRQTKPLKVQVMHSSVAAHQNFGLKALSWLGSVIGYSDGLRRILCQVGLQEGPDGENSSLVDRLMLNDSRLWKGARSVYHQLFMSSLLMDPKYKKLFAVRFAKNYQQLQRDFMEDDHERAVSVTALSVQFFTAPTLNYERLQSDYVTDDHDREFSVADLSVQIFTVPSLARMLITEENLMTVIIKAFMDHLKQRDAQGRFQFERYTALQAFKFRRVQSLILDLKYVLISKPTEWSDELRQKFLEGFDAFLELLKCMQGMDPITRQVGQHIEMEPEWEAAFTLQMKLTHVISMVQDWCALDETVLIEAYKKCLAVLMQCHGGFTDGEQPITLSISGHSVETIRYCVSQEKVSIHLPISRLLAGLHVLLSRSEVAYKFPELLPLIYYYHNVKCRREMFDKDIVMLQTGVSMMDPNHFLMIMLSRFELYQIFSTPDYGKRFSSEVTHKDVVQQNNTLIEEMLYLIIMLVGERFSPGVGQVSATDEIKREIIHQLSIKPMAHSELVKSLPEDENKETGMESVIETVAHFKKPGLTGRGMYELKPECAREFNLYFYHFSRAEQSKVLHLIGMALQEEKQHLENAVEGHVETFTFTQKISRPGDAPNNSPSILAMLETLQNAPSLEAHKDMIRWLLKSSRDKAERKRKAEIARLRREKVMAQMSAMQRNFIDENKELFQQTTELDASASAALDSGPLVSDTALTALGPAQTQVPEQRQLVTCILCQEEQEVTMESKAMVLAAFVQRSTVLSKDRTKFIQDPAKEQRRQQRLRLHTSYDVENGEFLCPLCECLSNTVIPLLLPPRTAFGRNPYSDSIKEMLTTFATATYKVGLKIHPNEEDPRVPIMCWGSCAYTIQSIERILSDEEKPLFGPLPCRLDDCLRSLTRFAAAHWTVASLPVVQGHFCKLFASLVPNDSYEDLPCILDIDMFHLLVGLVLAFPALQCQDFSGSSLGTGDLHIFRLVTMAHIVQILLTSCTEEDGMDQENPSGEEELAVLSLHKTLHQYTGSALEDAPSGWHLWRSVRTAITPFLKCSALFFHYLNGVPTPPDLQVSGTSHFEHLCNYLSLPTNLMHLFQENSDIMNCLVESYPRGSNKLIDLPEDYSCLINQASNFSCPKSGGDKSRAPTLCLVCGTLLCSQSYCCQAELEGEDVGACTAHTYSCGSGAGIFLRVRECQVLFLAGKTKGCFYSPPYLDDYGETDQGLRRGNPLHLCQERFRKIQKLWQQHSITEEIGHAQEANQTLVGIDWQHL